MFALIREFTACTQRRSAGWLCSIPNGRYAAHWNARQSSSGHVWQGRFYSCPFDCPIRPCTSESFPAIFQASFFAILIHEGLQ